MCYEGDVQYPSTYCSQFLLDNELFKGTIHYIYFGIEEKNIYADHQLFEFAILL